MWLGCCRSRDEGTDLDQVVGQDAVSGPDAGTATGPRPKGVMHRIHVSDSITTYKRTCYTTLEHVIGLGRRPNLGLRSKHLTQIQQKHGLYPVASRNPLRSRSSATVFSSRGTMRSVFSFRSGTFSHARRNACTSLCWFTEMSSVTRSPSGRATTHFSSQVSGVHY
jgi:hypothetical protein